MAVPLGLGCEKSASSGQAEVRDAGAVQSDVTKWREDYRHEKQSDLDSLDKGIADLQGKEKSISGKARRDVDSILDKVKSERDVFVGDLRSLDNTGAVGWDSTKARLDQEWAALKTANDKAESALASTIAGTHKPGEMTCEEFVALADIDKPKIVYWAEGFNKKGKPHDAVVDLADTDKVVPVLVSECMKAPKESLSTAIQRHEVGAYKPVASAPKPTTMTCAEFVELENTTQPKVVYWAEGFNKDGGVADSVVDIEETDTLVPVLIKECKEAPKLTLWQKLTRYF
jgi:hypothetical protein